MEIAAREKIKTTPLGVVEILDYSARYFWREMIAACAISAIMYFPVNLLGELIGFSVHRFTVNLALSLVNIGLMMLAGLCFPMVNLWTARMVYDKCENGTAYWGQNAQAAFVLWPLELWTLFLNFVIVFGLALLLFIPGVIWSVYYMFSTLVVARGSLWGKDALDYSKSLVKGRWWYVFIVTIVLSLTIVIPILLIWGIGMIVGLILGLHNAVLMALNQTFLQFSYPLAVFPLAVWFTNLDYLRKRQT
jgi:hypothetical protein